MNIKSWIEYASRMIEANGNTSTSARVDCLVMLEETLGRSRAFTLAHQSDELDEEKISELELLLNKRLNGVPLAYIVGNKEFYGLDFYVNDAVLIPRNETEALAEYAIERFSKGATMLEVGVGSGAISISIAKHRPDLVILATDISQDAISVARKNLIMLKIYNVDIKVSDMFGILSEGKKFDYIVANLPYVSTGGEAKRSIELTFEPEIALYSGKDGLDHYRKFLPHAKRYLSDKGEIVVEFDPSQIDAMSDLCAANKMRCKPITKFVYSIENL